MIKTCLSGSKCSLPCTYQSQIHNWKQQLFWERERFSSDSGWLKVHLRNIFPRFSCFSSMLFLFFASEPDFPKEYSSWETDEVITRELLRNLGIALACVFATTLLLLANFLGSVIVLVCVAVTLVSSIWGSGFS